MPEDGMPEDQSKGYVPRWACGRPAYRAVRAIESGDATCDGEDLYSRRLRFASGIN